MCILLASLIHSKDLMQQQKLKGIQILVDMSNGDIFGSFNNF